jgi:hypothetical protein
VIPENMGAAFFAKTEDHQTYQSGSEPILPKSGIPNFDLALVHTLSDMTAQFGVLPAFAYYEDGDHPQAYATKDKRLDRADGTVLFGLRMLRQTLLEIESPDVAVTAVCAHEYGHIVQIAYGLTRTLTAGQVTVKRAELHADFMAGYYAGTRKLRRPDYDAAVFATKLGSMGDDKINDPQHHGTLKERGQAVVQGFKAAKEERRPLLDAIRVGVQYVSTL